jgi:serine/threonine protein kinase
MSEDNSVPQPEVPPARPVTGSVDPQSVEGLFLAALAKPDSGQRRAFLDDACRDAEQRRRVEALLRAYADAGSFLETPAAGRSAAPGGRASARPDEVPLDFLNPSDQPGCLGAVGPYQIIDVIGRGGMGIVLRALDAKLNRIVAVKVLAPEMAANPNARRRFVREAQAAAAVSHPHVVTIHAVDEDKLPYLVMECIVGQSLQEKLDRAGPLRLTEILRIGRQVAEGLAAAHHQGLIHRDIKPANIMLENGVERVKITDFGLARAVDDVAITRAGEVSGTPQYLSPEQARGEAVDHRSDLFSLGCVLYAMCTGGPPFRGESLAAVIKGVAEAAPQPIGDLNPEIPAWLVDVVNRLLEKDPAQRYQSAAEVAEVLAGHLADVQQPARPAPLPRRERHVVSERAPRSRAVRTRGERILVWLAILFLSLLVLVPVCLTGAGLVFAMLARIKAPTGTEIAVPEGSQVEVLPLAPTEIPPSPTIGTPSEDTVAGPGPRTARDKLPPGVRWETESGVDTFAAGKVRLDVRLLSEGLLVVLRRRSVFNGGLAGEEHLATTIGTTHRNVSPGEYDVLVRDERFGWDTDQRGRIVVPERGFGTLTVERELATVVKEPPDVKRYHPATYIDPQYHPVQRFRWNGECYELRQGQAAAVQRLAAALLAGQPDVPDADVVKAVRPPWRHGETLEQNFRGADGLAPAWGKLVVPGQKPGTYRLAAIPQATLIIDLRAPMLQVDVLFPRDGDLGGGTISFEKIGQHRLTVRPGSYRMLLYDAEVHWLGGGANQLIPSRTEEIAVAADAAVTWVGGERHWQDYTLANRDAQEVPPKGLEVSHNLVWFGRGDCGFRQVIRRREGGVTAGFALSPPQAAFVSRLFQALADGKPDVAEDELLKAAGVRAMSELFPGQGVKTTEELWGPLFIPGQQPKTWRLNVPKQAETPAAGPQPTCASLGETGSESGRDSPTRNARRVASDCLTSAAIGSLSSPQRLHFDPDLLGCVSHLLRVVAVNERAVEAAQVLDDLRRVRVQLHFDLRPAGIQERGVGDLAGDGQPSFGFEVGLDDRQ